MNLFPMSSDWETGAVNRLTDAAGLADEVVGLVYAGELVVGEGGELGR